MYGISDLELLLHAKLNSQFPIWATGTGTELLEKLLNEIDISSIDLSGHRMKDAIFGSADLSYANLIDANLSHADLRFTDLSHADLRFTDLSHADLPDGVGRFK